MKFLLLYSKDQGCFHVETEEENKILPYNGYRVLEKYDTYEQAIKAIDKMMHLTKQGENMKANNIMTIRIYDIAENGERKEVRNIDIELDALTSELSTIFTPIDGEKLIKAVERVSSTVCTVASVINEK